MKLNWKGIGTVLAVVSVLTACETTTVRQHPDFASGKRKITTVAVMPPDVEFRNLVFTGENERDAEREKTIAAEIEAGMNQVLVKHGYTPKSALLDKAKAGDREFNFQLEQIRGAYGLLSKDLYARPQLPVEESTKFKLGVGPLANPFASLSGADALIFTRYYGFSKSDGLIAKEVVASALLAALTGAYYIPIKSSGQIELSLIDGVSGDVLWSNMAGGQQGSQAMLDGAASRLPPGPAAVSTTATAAANAATPAQSSQAIETAAASASVPSSTATSMAKTAEPAPASPTPMPALAPAEAAR